MLASAALKGCYSPNVLNTGFDVTFYRYPLLNKAFQSEPEFYKEGYKQFGYLQTVSGVEEINFSLKNPDATVTHGELYGYQITPSNFTVAITGYFLARETGNYLFNMFADDGGYLQLGAGRTCCGNVFNDVSGSSFKALWPVTALAIFNLTAGVYYPVKVVYVNWNGPARFYLRFVSPAGWIEADIGSHIYHIQEECTTSTKTWSESGTTTVLDSGSVFGTYVEVPTPTTTVKYYTGNVTTSRTVTGGPGETYTVVVDIPPETVTSYGTDSWARATTVTPSGGGQPTVYLDLPPGLSTSYWTNGEASTTTVTPYDGGQPTVVVQLPHTTTTSYWTEKYTSTDTEIPEDAQPTVVVLLPPATSKLYWTESFSSMSTIVPGNGSQPTVVVEVPMATATSYWTETYTSTTTGVRHGGAPPEVVIIYPFAKSTSYWTNNGTATTTMVPGGNIQPTILVQSPMATATSYWTQFYTSTVTIIADDGSQPTVVVQLPTVISTAYSIEHSISAATSSGIGSESAIMFNDSSAEMSSHLADALSSSMASISGVSATIQLSHETTTSHGANMPTGATMTSSDGKQSMDVVFSETSASSNREVPSPASSTTITEGDHSRGASKIAKSSKSGDTSAITASSDLASSSSEPYSSAVSLTQGDGDQSFVPTQASQSLTLHQSVSFSNSSSIEEMTEPVAVISSTPVPAIPPTSPLGSIAPLVTNPAKWLNSSIFNLGTSESLSMTRMSQILGAPSAGTDEAILTDIAGISVSVAEPGASLILVLSSEGFPDISPESTTVSDKGGTSYTSDGPFSTADGNPTNEPISVLPGSAIISLSASDYAILSDVRSASTTTQSSDAASPGQSTSLLVISTSEEVYITTSSSVVDKAHDYSSTSREFYTSESSGQVVSEASVSSVITELLPMSSDAGPTVSGDNIFITGDISSTTFSSSNADSTAPDLDSTDYHNNQASSTIGPALTASYAPTTDEKIDTGSSQQASVVASDVFILTASLSERSSSSSVSSRSENVCLTCHAISPGETLLPSGSEATRISSLTAEGSSTEWLPNTSNSFSTVDLPATARYANSASIDGGRLGERTGDKGGVTGSAISSASGWTPTSKNESFAQVTVSSPVENSTAFTAFTSWPIPSTTAGSCASKPRMSFLFFSALLVSNAI